MLKLLQHECQGRRVEHLNTEPHVISLWRVCSHLTSEAYISIDVGGERGWSGGGGGPPGWREQVDERWKKWTWEEGLYLLLPNLF